LRAAAISPTRLSQTSTAKADLRRSAAAIVLMEIGRRMAETEVDAVDVRAAAGGIVDAAGAVVGLVAVADGIAADAAGRAGEDTRNFLPRICTDQHGYEKEATARVVAFSCSIQTRRTARVEGGRGMERGRWWRERIFGVFVVGDPR